MKQNIKRIWLVLCMAVCLFALSGCGSKASVADEEIDPSILMTMQQGTQQELELFNGMTSDEELDKEIASAQKNKSVVFENALKSWQNIKDDLGAFVSSDTAEVTAGDEGYTAKMHAVYENREMEFAVMVDDNFTITSITFTPVYTVGEKMEKAALNTLMGMGTVFIVLIFISWLISCFKYINQWEANAKKKAAGKAAAAPAPAPAPAPVQAAPAPMAAAEAEEDVSDDTELVAVIAAAIAASEGKASADGLVVRSIKRVPNGNWKRA